LVGLKETLQSVAVCLGEGGGTSFCLGRRGQGVLKINEAGGFLKAHIDFQNFQKYKK
jgi:hypothetical protein